MVERVPSASMWLERGNRADQEAIDLHNARPGALRIHVVPAFAMFEAAVDAGQCVDGWHTVEETIGFGVVNHVLQRLCTKARRGVAGAQSPPHGEEIPSSPPPPPPPPPPAKARPPFDRKATALEAGWFCHEFELQSAGVRRRRWWQVAMAKAEISNKEALSRRTRCLFHEDPASPLHLFSHKDTRECLADLNVADLNACLP